MSVFAKASTSRSQRTIVGGIALASASLLVLAGCATPTPEESDGGSGPIEDYTMTIGTLLPQTGNLAFLGPPEEAGVAYPATQINDATADTGLGLDVV